MVQCEMCGKDVDSPNRVKIEGAELDVCDDCTDFGTEVRDQESSSGTSTKYSTGGSGSSSSGGASGSSSQSGGSSDRPRNDMFDQMDELAQDYDDRIRQARESEGLSQEELAQKLNEKASLIRKLERGDVLPEDSVQTKLERALEINLNAGSSGDSDEDWSGGSASGEYTLGDVVKRKD